ncbi:hypothetical protein QCN27_01555 [Cereibacter sp. SYSU M97828]|nr:hypothetical protein [Cereibacter flavus]
MEPSFTFFYIVEPPDYEIMACSLLASIRAHFPPSVRAIGYCPEHRMHELHPAVLRAHELMDAEIRPMKTEGMWDTPYPHGNKIIACLQPRDTAFSAFVDSDVLFLRENSIDNLVRPGQVACSVAASMRWADQSIWTDIYGAFGMEVPSERIALMRQRRPVFVPYYSSGFVIFPEGDNGHGRFADVWYDTARTIDRIETLEKRRPYLDQMSLPLAVRRAGYTVSPLPEEHHYILGGLLRNQPLPEDMDIFCIHYRDRRILSEVGLRKTAQEMLRSQTGERYVRRLAS